MAASAIPERIIWKARRMAWVAEGQPAEGGRAGKGAMPVEPEKIDERKVFKVEPMGVTQPRPVTTTRCTWGFPLYGLQPFYSAAAGVAVDDPVARILRTPETMSPTVLREPR